MSRPTDPSSTDLCLRHLAPPVLSEAWKRANWPMISDDVRLRRRFAFVETALRYVVALLAAEVEGRRLPPPGAWTDLRRRLERPTVGGWAAAASQLGQRVLAQPDPLLGEAATALAAGEAALAQLVEARNGHAHDAAPTDARVRALLAETEGPCRAWLVALRPIVQLPIWLATEVRARRDGIEAEVVGLRGAEPLPPRRVALARALDPLVPFLVGERGDTLGLAPLLAWGAFGDRRDPELRLFLEWDGAPRYADPEGEAPGTLDGAPPVGVDAWLAEAWRHAWTPGAVEAQAARDALLDPDRAEAPPELPGLRVGMRLGAGATGRVYLAHPTRPGLPDPVAVKVLGGPLAADRRWRERLRREYDAMRRLHAPGIVRVYDFLDDAPAGPTLVMEYVAGTDLAAVGRLDPAEATRVCREVLAALADAHAAGVIHRDVKPANVRLDAEGRARVLDFGIARVAGGEALTRTSDGLGTVGFSAPEQLNGGTPVDGRADLYAVGRLLGWLVSGSTAPAEQAAALPSGLLAVWRRATEPDPAGRYPDAAAFSAALARAQRAAWVEPPVEVGDVLAGSFRVEAAIERLDPGIWVLHARDEGLCERVGVLIAEPGPAPEALARGLRGLGEAQRRALGAPRVQHERGGLAWCLVPAEDPVAAARTLLGGAGRAGPTAPPPGPAADPRRPALAHAATAASLGAAVLTGSPLGLVAALAFQATQRTAAAQKTGSRHAVPPYLEGWPPARGDWAPSRLARRADRLALVVVAQAAVLGAPLDAVRWARLRSTPLDPALGVLGPPMAPWPAQVQGALDALRTRPRACQGLEALRRMLAAPSTPCLPNAVWRDVELALGLLTTVALQVSALAPPASLDPWLRPGTIGWRLRGADGHYEDLLETP